MSNFFKPPCDAAQIQAAALDPRCAKQDIKPWVLFATILGTSMAFIDGTVVNVALPTLQISFRAEISQVQWVVESYALVLAALVLVGGSLGDRFGRRAVFATGVLVFSLASVWCGLSANIHGLIVARAVQGAGAALLIPSSLALLSASFPEAERGRAIGTWSGFSGITAAFGPVLGGWLVQQFTWRWVFFINVPLAAAVLFILFLRVPETRAQTRVGQLDWLGAALATFSLGGLVYGLLAVPAQGWGAPAVVAAISAGVLGLVVFFLVEARASAPMLPLELFRSTDFTGANLLTFLLYAALGGALFFVPFNLIQVQDYSPLEAGASLLPFVMLMFLLSRWAGGLVTRYGSRLPLTVGPAITAIAFVLFSIPGQGGSYWTTFFPAIFILGVGMVISVAPLTTTVMGSVVQERSGAASGINNAVARLAGLLAIAILGLVVQSAFNSEADRRMAALHAPAPVQQVMLQQRSRLAAAEIPATIEEPLRTKLKNALDEAFIAAFRRVMRICAVLALAGGVAAAAFISRRKATA
jgi:EmrB/QacA subfamily drug resistance transporter